MVRQVFAWVSAERLSLAEVSRRLNQQGVPTPSGRGRWRSATVRMLLHNSAYCGTAAYGRTRLVPRTPKLRPLRGQPETPRRPYSVTRQGTEPILIAVPPLVSAEEFAAVAEQLAESRRRNRVRRAGASYLLQGLVVCRGCGYAFHGITRRRSRDCPTVYRYYRCGGRHEGDAAEAVACRMRQVRAGDLEDAVWADVCQLLSHPEKVEEEYRRRLEGEQAGAAQRQTEPLAKEIRKAQGTLARIIDAYSEGLLEKSEFEPRVKAAQERLGRLEAAAHDQAAAEARCAELRLALNCLHDFAEQVGQGLEGAEDGD